MAKKNQRLSEMPVEKARCCATTVDFTRTVCDLQEDRLRDVTNAEQASRRLEEPPPIEIAAGVAILARPS